MNITLWIIAAVLAAVFVAIGMIKLTTPRERLIEKLPTAADSTDLQTKTIAALEVLGGLGLILPAVFNIAPILVPIAATGLALMMVGAVIVHVRRGDGIRHALPAIVLGLLAVVVAVGRFGPERF
jgi:VIT1/CCC1 family predicted Fe2+/Mn2+ transporter